MMHIPKPLRLNICKFGNFCFKVNFAPHQPGAGPSYATLAYITDDDSLICKW